MFPTSHLTIKQADDFQQEDELTEAKSVVPNDADDKDSVPPTLETDVDGYTKKTASPEIQINPSFPGHPSPVVSKFNSAFESKSLENTQSPEWNKSYVYCAPSRHQIQKSRGMLCFREGFVELQQFVTTSVNPTDSANVGISQEKLHDVFERSLKEVDEKPRILSTGRMDWIKEIEVEERSTIVKFEWPRSPVPHPQPKVSWLAKKAKEVRAAARRFKDRLMGSSAPRPVAQQRPPKRPPASFKVWDQTWLWNQMESPLVIRSGEYSVAELYPVRVLLPPSWFEEPESDYDPETPLT